jgi:hypothetical protein
MVRPVIARDVPVKQVAVKQVERSREQRQQPEQPFDPFAIMTPPGVVMGEKFAASSPTLGAVRNLYSGEVREDPSMAESSPFARSQALLNSAAPTGKGGSNNIERVPSQELYQQAMDKLNQSQNLFNLFEALKNEPLSPQAQQQIQYLQEDTAQQLADIDYQLQNAIMREEAFEKLQAMGRAQAEGIMDYGRSVVDSGAASAAAGISGDTNTGLQNIGRVFDEAGAAAVNALPEELQTQGDLVFVMGGAEHADRRAELEAESQASARELQGLMESSVSDGAEFSQRINELSARAANAQIDLMGIQDEQMRHRSRMQLETGIRNEVYNLTTQRRDIEKNASRAERALREEADMRASGFMDRFGLGIDPTPEGVFDTVFTDGVESFLDRRGVSLSPIQRQNFDDAAGLYATSMSEEDKQAALAQMSVVTGLPITQIQRSLDSSLGNADRIYQDMASGDFSNAQPGSQAFGVLVAQTAMEMGVEPGLAVEWANSPSLHEYIRIASGGRAGAEKGGNLRGIGAIPEDVYETYGYSWEEVKGDPRKEMEVFLGYLMAHTGGDPSALLNEFMQNKTVDYSTVRNYNQSTRQEQLAGTGRRRGGAEPTKSSGKGN